MSRRGNHRCRRRRRRRRGLPDHRPPPHGTTSTSPAARTLRGGVPARADPGRVGPRASAGRLVGAALVDAGAAGAARSLGASSVSPSREGGPRDPRSPARRRRICARRRGGGGGTAAGRGVRREGRARGPSRRFARARSPLRRRRLPRRGVGADDVSTDDPTDARRADARFRRRLGAAVFDARTTSATGSRARRRWPARRRRGGRSRRPRGRRRRGRDHAPDALRVVAVGGSRGGEATSGGDRGRPRRRPRRRRRRPPPRRPPRGAWAAREGVAVEALAEALAATARSFPEAAAFAATRLVPAFLRRAVRDAPQRRCARAWITAPRIRRPSDARTTGRRARARRGRPAAPGRRSSTPSPAAATAPCDTRRRRRLRTPRPARERVSGPRERNRGRNRKRSRTTTKTPATTEPERTRESDRRRRRRRSRSRSRRRHRHPRHPRGGYSFLEFFRAQPAPPTRRRPFRPRRGPAVGADRRRRHDDLGPRSSSRVPLRPPRVSPSPSRRSRRRLPAPVGGASGGAFVALAATRAAFAQGGGRRHRATLAGRRS